MKSLLLTLISLIVWLQFTGAQSRTVKTPQNNDANWQKTDSLIEKGLPKSAFQQVDKIYRQSKASRNTPDFVKSLVYRFQLRNDIEAITLDSMVIEMENDIETLWEPSQQLMHAFLARLYQSYLNNQRWQLMQTEQATTGSRHISDMTFRELTKKIIDHRVKSLRNPQRLQNENTSAYKRLLSPDQKKMNLRPTLYDLLAVEAAETLISGNLFTLPTDEEPVFDDKKLLGSTNQFLSVELPGTSTGQPAAIGFSILKEWLTYRLQQPEKAAFIDADLYRIKWMKDIYTGESGFSLVEKTLQQLAEQAKTTDLQSSVLYELAKLYDEMPTDEKNAETQRKIWDLAMQAKQQNPGSEGARLADNLLNNLTKPEITIAGESVIPVRSAIPLFINYRNTNKIYIYIYDLGALNLKITKSLNSLDTQHQIEKNMPVWRETVTIPDEKDFLTHTAELTVNGPQKPGYYALVVTHQPFSGQFKQTKVFQIFNFQKSDLCFLQRNKINNRKQITVLDRTSGMPVNEVAITSYEIAWRKDSNQMMQHPSTNEKGQSILETNKNYSRYFLSLSKNDDRFFSYFYWRPRYPENQKTSFNRRLFLFTDRAIYRPGQTIFFKGILMESNGKEARTLEKETINIHLKDVNGNKLTEQNLRTNKYGSVTGQFVLPSDVLTGSFSIQSEDGNTGVMVEEYKRPKIEVTFTPFRGLNTIGDTITTTAMALTYTGAPVQNAKVTWKVERHTFQWPYYRSHPQPVATGNTQTNDKGMAEITFKAISNQQKVYSSAQNFIVTVDITAPNGETQSATQSISLNKTAIVPAVNIPQLTLNPGKAGIPATITLKNFSNEETDATISYEVEQLQPRNTPKPQRYWSLPDTILTKTTPFTTKTDDASGYETIKKILAGSANINGSKKIILPITESGIYRLNIAVKDVSGDTIQQSTLFKTVNSHESTYPLDEAITLLIQQKKLNPGDSIHAMMGSVYPNAYAGINITQDGETIYDDWFTLNNNWQSINWPVTSKMVGAINVQATVVYQNRFYEASQWIDVEDPAHQQKIELSSFRDKTLPGSEETWELTVTDGQKKPVSTEVMALMYDASLDAYSPHQIYFNPFTVTRNSNQWQANGFSNAGVWGDFSPSFPFFQPANYPTLFWEIISYSYTRNNNRQIKLRGLPSLKRSRGDETLFMMVEDDVEIEEELDIVPATRQEQVSPPPPPSAPATIQPRTQLQETAFFLPFLESDSNGIARFSFTMPESLTRWHFMALAHRTDGVSATTENNIITARDLMVMPNLPRVMREGDQLWLTTSIINNSEDSLSGTACLSIKDAITEKELKSTPGTIQWQARAKKSTTVRWLVKVPENSKGIELTISATTGHLTDGETHFIPVLPAKVRVTETLPITINTKGKHVFTMETLTQSKNRQFEDLTFTYTANAVWEMLDALPWLNEQPYECNDQIFNRYFAAAMANNILNQNPDIKKVLKLWRSLPADKDALTSAMERNQELKSALLMATPWVTEAQNDTERRRRLAAMADDNYLKTIQTSAIARLKNNQQPDGAWAWFNGMSPSQSTTINIITGFGYLLKAGVSLNANETALVQKSVDWLQADLNDKEKKMKETHRDTIAGISNNIIRSLYALSFYDKTEDHPFWMNRLTKNLSYDNLRLQAMIATILHRNGATEQSHRMLQSLEEHLIENTNHEAFFKNMTGPYWYQSPIETHIAALEAFREITPGNRVIKLMENWLINQKRSQAWGTTQATVSAIYGLTQSQTDYFAVSDNDKIKLGNTTLKTEAAVTGTGFISQAWHGNEIQSKMGRITIQKETNTPSWASLHLAWFQPAAEVTDGGFMQVKNQLYRRTLQNNHEAWLPVTDETVLTTGDRIMMRIEIEAPQELDFVHVQSPRAANLEPIDKTSGYHWEQGLGYYQSITDAGMAIFIDHLPKGKSIITWQAVISMKGKATNVPTTVSCFYAPEFAGHGNGTVLDVK
ncbi:alpha-2-macroglobulin family protein [Geofilum sp. OHC36d9]|uniref:alpha-2-macroglobulin family protein n=1 Tax=Geofilum sp. OHC36d9 TaxID=3458413 RepID=UPI004033779F